MNEYNQPLTHVVLNAYGVNSYSFKKNLKGEKDYPRRFGGGMTTPSASPSITAELLIGKNPEVIAVETKEALSRLPLSNSTINTDFLKIQSTGPTRLLQSSTNRIVLDKYREIMNTFLPTEDKDSAISSALRGLSGIPGNIVGAADEFAESVLSSEAGEAAGDAAGAAASFDPLSEYTKPQPVEEASQAAEASASGFSRSGEDALGGSMAIASASGGADGVDGSAQLREAGLGNITVSKQTSGQLSITRDGVRLPTNPRLETIKKYVSGEKLSATQERAMGILARDLGGEDKVKDLYSRIVSSS